MHVTLKASFIYLFFIYIGLFTSTLLIGSSLKKDLDRLPRRFVLDSFYIEKPLSNYHISYLTSFELNVGQRL